MAEIQASKWKRLWLLPPIIIGVALFMMLKGGKQEPETTDIGEHVRIVRIHEVTKSDYIPVAQGYGVIEPSQVWKGIAQVSGRIVETHPRLRNGEIIKKGEVLLKVDPVDYELLLAQAKTQLAELDVMMGNSQSSLKIEKRNLALAEAEYQRQQKLAKKGSVSRSSADAAQRTMLNSRSQVQNLTNTLSLIPTQKKLQEAKITQAQRDLANVQVIAPFNMSVSGLAVELDQYISKGQVLLTGDSFDSVEVIAQVSLSSLKKLFYGRPDLPNDIGAVSKQRAEFTGFKPIITLDMGNDTFAHWDAEFVRFSDKVDSQTRTIGVVIAVSNPMSKAIPGERPPLSKGMFVEVAIAGIAQKNSIVVPSMALRGKNTYLMDDESRLKLNPVTVLYTQAGDSVIKSGLKEGDKLVLSDLIPAVSGMLLKTVEEE